MHECAPPLANGYTQAFIAEAPELPGCMADGKTRAEAWRQLEIVMAEWIETARDLGRVFLNLRPAHVRQQFLEN